MSTSLPPPIDPRADSLGPEPGAPPPPPGPIAVPPPPAGGWVPPPPPFRSARRRATILRFLLVGVIVASGIEAAANLEAALLLARLDRDANSVSLAQVDLVDGRMGASGAFAVIALLVAFGFLVAWTSRLYRNLRPLGVTDLRYTEGWAIGAWFVPFLNLVRPKQILNDVWRASEPGAPGATWRFRSVTALLDWWWGLWILGSILAWTVLGEPATLARARSAATRSVVADVVLIVAAALTIVVVTRLTDRQDRRADEPVKERSRWVPAAVLSPLLGLAAFGIAFAGFEANDGSADDASDERSGVATSSTSSSRRTKLVKDLVLGDCLENPMPAAPAGSEVESVLAVNVVACADAHEQEVVGEATHPADEDSPFPGQDALFDYAATACTEEFEVWVGRVFAESSLDMNLLSPMPESWEVGDRTILCLAYRIDGQPLEGSVRGTGV